jgi:hypothetical protein
MPPTGVPLIKRFIVWQKTTFIFLGYITMPLKTVEVGNMHRLIDNGCGDYDFICPVKGRTGWLPPLKAMAMSLRKDYRCGACDSELDFSKVKSEFENNPLDIYAE